MLLDFMRYIYYILLNVKHSFYLASNPRRVCSLPVDV